MFRYDWCRVGHCFYLRVSRKNFWNLFQSLYYHAGQKMKLNGTFCGNVDQQVQIRQLLSPTKSMLRKPSPSFGSTITWFCTCVKSIGKLVSCLWIQLVLLWDAVFRHNRTDSYWCANSRLCRNLSLVCLLREDNFAAQGVIDYNFRCFREAVLDILEVRRGHFEVADRHGVLATRRSSGIASSTASSTSGSNNANVTKSPLVLSGTSNSTSSFQPRPVSNDRRLWTFWLSVLEHTCITTLCSVL